jgi:hypothetical protein
MAALDDRAALKALRGVFNQHIARHMAGGGLIEDPWTPGDDYGTGRMTPTPEERRNTRERRIAARTVGDLERSSEWDRFIHQHHGNPLTYGMEALSRIPMSDVWGAAYPIQSDMQEAYPGWGSRLSDAALSVANMLPGEALLSRGIKPITAAVAPLLGNAAAAAGQEIASMFGDDSEQRPWMRNELGYVTPGYADGGMVSNMIRNVARKFGKEQAARATQAADYVDLSKFNERSLNQTFAGTNKFGVSPGLYSVLAPDEFERYSVPISDAAQMMEPYPRWLNAPKSAMTKYGPGFDDYIDNIANLIKTRGLPESPMLWIGKQGDDTPNITAHEGRHRMRALDQLGVDNALITIRPSNYGELAGDVPDVTSRMLEKYFSNDPVNQEVYPESHRLLNRGAVNFPGPVFGEGGSVLTRLARSIVGKPDRIKLPNGEYMAAQPLKEFEDVAQRFADRYGNEYPIKQFPDYDVVKARQVADAYELMRHDPSDPAVKRAYDALIQETMDQYKALERTGVDFSFLKPGEADPYAKTPTLGYLDLVNNGRLRVFPTDSGYGTLSDINDNPLLKRVGRVGDLNNATANDAFRVVHDALGHFGPGNPFFRAPGEERAWLLHGRSYSPDALPAATTELRGQNSWVNQGPYASRNTGASGADTVYADQKTGLLPSWAWEDKGYADGGPVGDRTVKPAIQSLLRRLKNPNGGFTWQPFTRHEPSSGYATSLYPERSQIIPSDEMTADKLWRYQMRNYDLLRDPDHYLGAWHDPGTGNIYLDVSHVGPSLQEISHLARGANQKAIFDLDKFQSIDVGGTGSPLDPDTRFGPGYADGGEVVNRLIRSLRTRKATQLEDEARALNRGRNPGDTYISPEVDPKLQTVDDPRRIMYPLIYAHPDDIINMAREHYTPDPGTEGPMYQLFGHTRQSLDDLSQNERPFDFTRPDSPEYAPFVSSRREGAPYTSQVMNPRNNRRIRDVLSRGLDDPTLRAMRSWYELSPMYDVMGSLNLGEREQRGLNARMGVMSPLASPDTEIPRGFMANYLSNEGRLDDFVRYGGWSMQDKLNSETAIPPDLMWDFGHSTHGSHVPNLMEYETLGRLWPSPSANKVNTYIEASAPRLPYWQRPVADSHFTRMTGLPDVRTANITGALRGNMTNPEYAQMYPWWNSRIAGELDQRPRDAQALAWGLFGPTTGVKAIGAPKLELISNYINDVANARGWDPIDTRNKLLRGEIGGYAEGGAVDDDLGKYHTMFYSGGGSVDDDLALYGTAFYDEGGIV